MSKKRSSIRKINNESTVTVQDSPTLSIKQKGNLTGNARVIRDHVADISNLIQQWNTDLLAGMTIVSLIKNLLFKKINSKKFEYQTFSENLQSLSKSLENVLEKMELTVEKLGQKNHNLLALRRLEALQSNQKPLFLTWPTQKFVEISHQIYEMFKKEMEMKLMIKEEICFCNDKNLLIFYATAWSHQPYIEKTVNLSFEAMLKEVGHSPL